MKSITSIEQDIVPDMDPDLSYLQADYPGDEPHNDSRRDRLAAYDRDEWHMIGVRAVAHIRINGIAETITSAGLWGIESDSDESYVAEVYAEELETLCDMLKALGFTEADIAACT